jgi:hypothetical protein
LTTPKDRLSEGRVWSNITLFPLKPFLGLGLVNRKPILGAGPMGAAWIAIQAAPEPWLTVARASYSGIISGHAPAADCTGIEGKGFS